jgi:hypothetical protein
MVQMIIVADLFILVNLCTRSVLSASCIIIQHICIEHLLSTRYFVGTGITCLSKTDRNHAFMDLVL